MKQDSATTASRKNFLLLGIAAFFFAAGLRLLTRSKKEKTGVVRMLTQDGHLVEIDKDHIVTSGNKITDIELQQWVKKMSNN